MKKSLLIPAIAIVFILTTVFATVGCKKETASAGTGDIEFVSLVVEKDNLAITELTKVTATVKGSNLSYTWKCDNELGVIEGAGAEVMFTICHGGKFKITCEVSDNANHTASKEAYVTYVE
jgi:hypothetical protein